MLVVYINLHALSGYAVATSSCAYKNYLPWRLWHNQYPLFNELNVDLFLMLIKFCLHTGSSLISLQLVCYQSLQLTTPITQLVFP
jgi:hypothetical protein